MTMDMNSNKTDKLSNQFLGEANSGNPKVRQLKKLMIQGAFINFQTSNDGYSALMYAVKGPYDRITEYLLKQGANPLLVNYENKMASELISSQHSAYLILKDFELLFATLENNQQLVAAVISAGALVNFQGPNGYSALMIAAEQNFTELVDFLLLQGADTTLKLVTGQKALDLTTAEEIRNLLTVADNWEKMIPLPEKNRPHRFFNNQKNSYNVTNSNGSDCIN